MTEQPAQGAAGNEEHDEEETESPEPSTFIPAEKAYYLHRTEVLQELKSELTSWFKGRFWWLAILLGLAGVVSLNAVVSITIQQLVSDEVKEANRSAVKATIATNRATDAASKATASAEKAAASSETARVEIDAVRQKAQVLDEKLREVEQAINRSNAASASAHDSARQAEAQAAELGHFLQELRGLADGIENRLVRLGSEIEAEGANARARTDLEIEPIKSRLDALEGFVDLLATDKEEARETLPDLTAKAESIETARGAQRETFDRNSEYTIDLSYDRSFKGTVEKMKAHLSALGYRVTLYEFETSIRENKVQCLVPDRAKAEAVVSELAEFGLSTEDISYEVRESFELATYMKPKLIVVWIRSL